MQSKEKITKLGTSLPRGSKKIIAKKAGVSYRTILMFFDGEELSFEMEAKIIPIIQQYIELIKEIDLAKQKMLSYAR